MHTVLLFRWGRSSKGKDGITSLYMVLRTADISMQTANGFTAGLNYIPAVSAKNFVPWVLCQLNETIRRKDYGTIWQVGITNDKVLLDSLDSSCQIKCNTRECLRRCHALPNHAALLLFCFLWVYRVLLVTTCQQDATRQIMLCHAYEHVLQIEQKVYW